MRTQAEQGKRVFRSIDEFRQVFFPNAYRERVIDREAGAPKEFGTGIAEELLRGARQRLANK